MSLGALLGLALSLKLIGTLDLPKDLTVDGAPLGGVSGVDYDRRTGDWLMISDDRSDKAPARFFVGRLDYDAHGVKGLRLTGQVPLRQPDGSTFAGSRSPSGERVDAEALRIDPRTSELVWTSEGDAARGFDPSLRRMNRAGAWRGTISTPPAFRFDPAKAEGARPNQTFEGVSFSPGGRWLWLAMEAPLVEDGAVSTVAQGGVTRITRLDRSGRVMAQYAYRLDPVQAAALHRGDNGVSEILAVDDRRLLVLERSGVEGEPGRFAFHCRLYLVDLATGQDIAGRRSLLGATPRTLAKRLLVNFDHVPGGAVNLEAMTWGRELGGKRTLVLLADDNFATDQAQRVLVFGVR
ncbi:esterase-like activity of phytase family protein [Caulobacter sp.]|uniref:esterase-like activity of phytase family protein n=1 Tax=Caulobacter sp. TaxID=78 RepID=UPI002B490E8B|nr:esterase-like activity of phytase family protein [Caulobacter sp.]HJV43982.1 esterase-like activity of phytase family protein [Caulobacter sp.]